MPSDDIKQLQVALEKSVKNFRSHAVVSERMYMGFTLSLGAVVIASLLYALFGKGGLNAAGISAASSPLLIFTFRRIEAIRRCMWEASQLEVVLLAGGKKALLNYVKNNACGQYWTTITELKVSEDNEQ